MPSPPPVAILAHRGDSARSPENTVAAFASAIDAGADGVECDVHLDGSGVPRVFHDDDTERLTGVPGAFAAHPPEVLASLRVGGEPIPTLAEVAEALDRADRPLIWNVELKPTARAVDLVAACRDILTAAAERHAVVVSTFDPRIVAALASAALPIRVAYLYEDLLALRALRFLPGAEDLDLHPRHDLVDAAHLAEYAAAGRAFRCWTVDSAAELERLAALGVAAVITNTPGPLRAARDALRHRSIAP